MVHIVLVWEEKDRYQTLEQARDEPKPLHPRQRPSAAWPPALRLTDPNAGANRRLHTSGLQFTRLLLPERPLLTFLSRKRPDLTPSPVQMLPLLGLPWWQRLGIHLPGQGTQVRSLLWEDSTPGEVTEPVHPSQ